MIAARFARGLVLVAAAVSTIAVGRTARACDFAPDVPRVEAPVDAARDVPTNPVLWLGFDFEIEGLEPRSNRHILRASDGSEIALTVQLAGSAGIRVMLPELELEPRTQYQLLGCHDDECELVMRTFTTGDGPDLEAPPLPVEEGRSAEIERAVGPCGGTFRWNELDIAFEGVLVVDVGLPEFDEGTLRGAADVITTEHDAHVVIDQDGVPRHDEHVAARMGAFDQAGNFSGWQQLDPLLQDGCGCRAPPRRVDAWMLLPLSLLCGARRRRAMTPHSSSAASSRVSSG